MLQAFTRQSGASGRAANEKTAATHVGRGPDQVADALKSEHGVIDEKGNGWDPVVGVRRAGCDERAHRSRLGNSFLENLTVLRFFVIEQRVHVDRLVVLADAGINSHLAE